MTRKKRQAMTLIEVMVAMAIVAIVATLLWAGFSQTLHNKKRVEEVADRFHAIRMALDRIQRELSMSFVSAHVNANSQLATVKTAFVGKDHSGSDRIDFTSFGHRRLFRNARESDQNEISYFLAPDPENRSKKVLARREQNRIDDDPRKGGKVQVLLSDVLAFNLEYLDPQSHEWLREWDTTQITGQPNRLPSQVKITVTIPDILDPSDERTFGTRAAVPITWALNHAAYNP
ncbi:MAG: prepilin-type N-terminal cleavage/methylation domain-containing protein [Myxococcales bacterium]|nr:prepilin-type N-terminal cleavage/methylation domain-containing protein [Myxococcales bacterium]